MSLLKDGLRRTVWKGPARAFCEWPNCSFSKDGVWSETAGEHARKHTRDTGHTTKVRYEHTTEYEDDPGRRRAK